MKVERGAARAKTRRLALVALVALVALAATASGCVVNEPETPTRGVVVSGPPPALVAEQPPPPPGPQATWVPGYWHWTGLQYAWIPGHWETPPPGLAWSAPRYTNANGHTVYETGGWRPAGAPASRNALR